MQGKSSLKEHAFLVDSMAETAGVDLELSVMEGRLSMDQLADAVLACTGCSEVDQCRHWLQSASSPEDGAPGYCRNRDTFRRLADGKNA